MSSLPATGDSNWGNPLNDYITNVVLAEANTAEANIASHQVAGDPHGDRAYALALVAPLTSGVNGPNGFLQLNSIGKIPTAQLPPGGGRTSAFDVVKDYSAPVNGTAASSFIQSALNDCGTAGGGEVWVGDGTFGIDVTLYVPSNVWLHLSPGATMTRIIHGGSGLAPVYMVANFNGAVSSSGSGNILIQGGTWVFDSQPAAGVPMAFVNGAQIVVQNTAVRTLLGSPAILAAGMTGFGAENILFSTATPGGSRASYSGSQPAVRVENASSSAISGLNSGMYTNAPCSLVTLSNCAITGGTASDGSGLYTAFGGLAGTTSPVSGSFHTNILVAHNATVALPANAVYPANWKTATITSNQFNITSGVTATASWLPSAPGGVNQVITDNGTGDPSSASTTLSAYKSGTTSRSSTTSLSLDPDLQVTVAANAVYEVRASIGYLCASTSAGISFDFQVPSGTFGYTENVAVTTGGGAGVYFNTSGTPDNAQTGGGSNTIGLQFMGLLKVSSIGGTFGLKWAQNSSSSSALILQASSYLVLNRIA